MTSAASGSSIKWALSASPTTTMAFGEKGQCQRLSAGGACEKASRSCFTWWMPHAWKSAYGAKGSARFPICIALWLCQGSEAGAGHEESKSESPGADHRSPGHQKNAFDDEISGGGRCGPCSTTALTPWTVVETAPTKAERRKWQNIVEVLIPVCKAYPTEKRRWTLLRRHPDLWRIRLYPGVSCRAVYARRQGRLHFWGDHRHSGNGFCPAQGGHGGRSGVRGPAGGYGCGNWQGRNPAQMAALRRPGQEDPNSAGERYRQKWRRGPKMPASSIHSFRQRLFWMPREMFSSPIFCYWSAMVAEEKLEAGFFGKRKLENGDQRKAFIEKNASAAFLAGKLESARFFIASMLPVTDGKLSTIAWGDLSAWAIFGEVFLMELVDRILAGEAPAMARMISMVERHDKTAPLGMKRLYGHCGRSSHRRDHRPAGCRKKLPGRRLDSAVTQSGNGLSACWPSTRPALFTGWRHFGEIGRAWRRFPVIPGVFIRSLFHEGGRWAGLSEAVNSAVDVFDAAGKDVVLIETVGVGQNEIDIVNLAHTLILVAVPGYGDGMQALKSRHHGSGRHSGGQQGRSSLVPAGWSVKCALCPARWRPPGFCRTRMQPKTDGWLRSCLRWPSRVRGLPELVTLMDLHFKFLKTADRIREKKPLTPGQPVFRPAFQTHSDGNSFGRSKPIRNSKNGLKRLKRCNWILIRRLGKLLISLFTPERHWLAEHP